MIPTLRLLTQSLFLLLSASVFYGLVPSRDVVAFYDSMHVLPSLSAVAHLALPPFIAATVLVLVLPLLAGRLYCAFLCPVGFLQDLSRRAGKHMGVRKARPRDWSFLRYFLFFLAFALVVTWSSAYHYLDHFSNLGRLYGTVFSFLGLTPRGWGFAMGLLFGGVVLIVPVFFPRWFCSAVCPSGTLFALLQRRSLWKPRVGEDCNECGKCGTFCPAQCMDKGVLEADRCIHCLECVSGCPQGAVAFSFGSPFKKTGKPEGRWKFLASAAGGIGLAFAGERVGLAKVSGRATVPPGGKSFDAFMQRCAACDACVSVCPTRVLRPSGLENGLGALGKARMDFGLGYCSFECNACLGVCPTGAISYFPLETKKKVKIGSAKIDRNTCIPWAEIKACLACHEVCPTGAIGLKPKLGVDAPFEKDEYCIGCGACEHACPVLPVKSIIVEPAEIHTFASKAPPDDSEPASVPKGPDFPF